MKAAWLLLAGTVGLWGCDYGGSDGGRRPEAGCGQAAAAVIDTGAELEIDPGEGVGVFFEYLGEGSWRVTTTCDTPVSGSECFWDVFVNVAGDGAIADFGSQDLEAGDAIGFDYDGTLQFATVTSGDADVMLLSATPGASLLFETYLDAGCASPYVFWIGDGAVHSGSPGNPLELVPSE